MIKSRISISMTMMVIPFLIIHILYDIWYDTFYQNNGDARVYKLCIYAKLYDCLLQWSNTDSKKVEVCKLV